MSQPPSNMTPRTLVWFRRDLRLTDNSAWNRALELGQAILPVYIHAPEEIQPWQPGAASNWWLHHALEDLGAQLLELGLSLQILRPEIRTSSLDTLNHIIDQYPVSHVLWNRCYEPAMVKRDQLIKQSLQAQQIGVESFNGSLLTEPHSLRNRSGKPFLVFTPFWKHCLTLETPRPITSRLAPNPSRTPLNQAVPLTGIQLLPTQSWDQGLQKNWQVSRAAAEDLLQQSIAKSDNYADRRDLPAKDGTSRLSAYLHFGQVSPAEVWHTIRNGAINQQTADNGVLRQLYWREFSTHLLYHFPHSQNRALKERYDLFPWKIDQNLLTRWQRGETGFPIVDAGMRQLWQTGWMHNRVRMITASFLVKHLLQPWQEGARWFWDTLVDADLANNTMGWQWIAGSGADASPYFRIFNPILQGKKFDPDGEYIKTWLPELAQLPAKFIHQPWELDKDELESCGVRLGDHYPTPVISHNQGRQQAMDAYTRFKQGIPHQ